MAQRRTGEGLRFADHAVEHLDSEGDLAVLTKLGLGARLGADQVLVSAHGGFDGVVQSWVTRETGLVGIDPGLAAP